MMLQTYASLDDDLAALFAGDRTLCANPYPVYKRLREASPAYPIGPDLVAVSRYQDVRTVFHDASRFRQWKGETGLPGQFDLLSDEEIDSFRTHNRHMESNALSALDGDAHRRIRA